MKETVTIIALIPSKENISIKDISNKAFFKWAKDEGKILTLNEFCDLWNNDNLSVKDWYSRSLEVSKDSFRLV